MEWAHYSQYSVRSNTSREYDAISRLATEIATSCGPSPNCELKTYGPVGCSSRIFGFAIMSAPFCTSVLVWINLTLLLFVRVEWVSLFESRMIQHYPVDSQISRRLASFWSWLLIFRSQQCHRRLSNIPVLRLVLWLSSGRMFKGSTKRFVVDFDPYFVGERSQYGPYGHHRVRLTTEGRLASRQLISIAQKWPQKLGIA